MEDFLFSLNYREFTPAQQYSIYMNDKHKFSEQNDLIKFAIRYTFLLYDKNVINNLASALSFLGFAKAGVCYALLSKMSKNQFYSNDQNLISYSGSQWLPHEDNILFSSIIYGSPPYVPSRTKGACKLRLMEWQQKFASAGIYVLPCKFKINEKIHFEKEKSKQEERGNKNIENFDVTAQTTHKNYQAKNWEAIQKRQKIICERTEKMRKLKYVRKRSNSLITTDTIIYNKEFSQEFQHILKIMENNLIRKPSYDPTAKKFWLKVNSLGRKTFDFLKFHMNGPSRSTIYEWSQKEDYPRFEDFINIKKTGEIIRFWRKLYNSNHLTCILSIDAMKVDEDLSIDHKNQVYGVISHQRIKIPENIQNDNSLYINLFEEQLKKHNIASAIFIASICPLCDQIKTFPLYIYLSSSQSADKNILDYIKNIKEPLEKENIHIIGISTDSDQSYRSMFNKFFYEWSKYLLISEGNVMKIMMEQLLVTNDCPHLLKRARSRLVTKKFLFVNKDDWNIWKKNVSEDNLNCNNCISKETLQKVNDELLDCWFRNSGQDAMDDFYPHHIFSPQTLKKAIEKNMSSFIIFVSPILLMIRILRDNDACRKQRIIWCYVSLFIFQFYYSWLNVQCYTGKSEKKKEDYPSIFSMNFCIDCSNYLFSLIRILTVTDDDFSIRRVGTITSEHLFSQLRFEAKKEQTVRSIKHAFDRLILRKKFGEKEEKFEHRMFSSAKAKDNTGELQQDIIKNCIYFAMKLCINAGIKFPRESSYYELMQNLDSEKGDLFYEEQMEILCQNNLRTHQRKEQWRIQISQVRRTNKIGREIKVRLATKFK